MTQVLSLILAGGKGDRLSPLTRDRAKPAVTWNEARDPRRRTAGPITRARRLP